MLHEKSKEQRQLERELFLENKYKGKTFKDRKKEMKKLKWFDDRVLDYIQGE